MSLRQRPIRGIHNIMFKYGSKGNIFNSCKTTTILLLLILFLLLFHCNNSIKDEVIATVNQKVILISDVERISGKKTGELGFAETVNIVREMVTFELLYQTSLKLGLQNSSDVTNIAVKKLLDQEITYITMDNKELEKEFDLHRDALEKAEARHILIGIEKDDTETKIIEKRGLIEELRNRVKKGEDFCTLAKKYTYDLATAESCGNLGKFGRGNMVREFEDATFALEKPFDLSPVFRTMYGYHFIQLINRSLPLKGNEEIYREKLLRKKKSDLFNQLIKKLKQNADIEVKYDLIK